MSSNPLSKRSAAFALTLAATAVLAVSVGVGVAAAAAPAPSTYPATSAAGELWAVEATLTSQRDAAPAGTARKHLERALQSIHWALADVHWTAQGSLVDGQGGANALRDLRTTIGRLTWVDAKEAYERDVVAIVDVFGEIAHGRYDDVKRFVGDGGSPLAADVRSDWRQRLVAAARDLRVGDASGDRVQAALAYTRVWQRLAGLGPCCSAAPSPTLLGNEAPGSSADYNPAGLAEAFRTTAVATGTVTKIRIYVGPDSAAAALVAGVYADDGGHPGALLAQGRLEDPTADAWNVVPLASGAPVVAWASYWIAFLAPDASGTLRFRDGCCGAGAPTEVSAERNLTELPTAWTMGVAYSDGPPAAHALG